VMGHIGFTPQSVNQIGTRVQGREARAAAQLIVDALAIEAAGAFGIVLELIPAELAAVITSRLRIPTIGIGAGAGCTGQVQVWHDMLGLYRDFAPRHAKHYANLADQIGAAVESYASEVRAGSFPGAEHSATMPADTLTAALAQLADRAGEA